MKHFKWILPAIALLLTTAGLWAMNTKGNTRKQTSDIFYWYEFNPSTNQLGALLNPSSSIKIAKEDVPTDCQDDIGQPHCVRTYNENNRAGQINPPPQLDVILMTAP